MGGRVEEVSHGWKAKSRGAEYQEKSQLERLNESGEYLHIPETLDLQSHWSHVGIELLLHGPKQKSTYSMEAITVIL